MGDVKVKNIDGPLQEGEEPMVFLVVKKFMILESYFTDEQYGLPCIYRKQPTESDDQYQDRIYKLLLALDEKRFTDISNLIDPSDQM